MRRLSFLALAAGLAALLFAATPVLRAGSRWFDDDTPSAAEIRAAFSREGIRLSVGEAEDIRDEVELALDEARKHGVGNSKVDFAAVEIANRLDLDTSPGSNSVRNVVAAIRRLHEGRGWYEPRPRPRYPRPEPRRPEPPRLEWDHYFDRTLGLWQDQSFLSLVREKGFHPVKISWEDIGRHENSVWGDRISDVGIWVRRDEENPASAQLALSVRRDGNFRDKVLVVPASAIKIHQRLRGRTVEKTLPERLAELGLSSERRDRNVIVSNQFAIVPVPAHDMHGAWPEGVPPRAAFNFSIFPYGSTNFVITDVIEGSHEAIVGPGQHQLLFANVDGQKAPFTASRAEDRQDLLRLERELKARGMDVDVQRYYLIQVPLRRDARVRLSNMGTPHGPRAYDYGVEAGLAGGMPTAPMEMDAPMATGAAPSAQAEAAPKSKADSYQRRERRDEEGLARVAIGHGDEEGVYDAGSCQRGARADEPIRVTVVYFVTPVGEVTRRDMQSFASAFASWDSQAIWGGSFVTKEGD